MKLAILEFIVKSFPRLLKDKVRFILICLSVFFALVCILATILHYTNAAYGNIFTWLAWLLSMAFLCTGLGWHRVKNIYKVTIGKVFSGIKKRASGNSKTIRIFLYLIVIFVFSHVWNWQTAPWNENGLFDDAAWDIYFSRIFITPEYPFQAAWWQQDDSSFKDEPSSSAKEVLFHYYITLWFNLFGYNILVFRISVMVLNFLAYLFTMLLIQSLFRNRFITFFSGILLCFLPIFYLHGLVGHRYVMAPTLIMASLFFMHEGRRRSSHVFMAVSGILAGLCFMSAIMGKQLIYAAAGAFVLMVVFNFRKTINRENVKLYLAYFYAVIVASIPMFLYTVFVPKYATLEGGYFEMFFDTLRFDGWNVFKTEYIDRMMECLFGVSWHKWFLPSLPIIPFWYYIFILPGLVYSLIKREFIYPMMTAIPFAASFVAGFSDYRIMIASPIWIIFMAYSFHLIINKIRLPLSFAEVVLKIPFIKDQYSLEQGLINRLFKKIALLKKWLFWRFTLDKYHAYKELLKKNISEKTLWIFKIIIIMALCAPSLLPSAYYLWEKSLDPYSVNFFAQKEVVESRYLLDIAKCVPHPSIEMKHDEFCKPAGYQAPHYDTLIALEFGYAIPHLFFQDYDAHNVFSLMGQLPFNLYSEEELFHLGKSAILAYKKTDKDLKIIWENAGAAMKIIEIFRRFEKYGSGESFTIHHRNFNYNFYALYIKNDYILAFQNDVSYLRY
ncbi:MAG: glycosyltransferase family 39 protein [Spirochaetales bacterium]|nr:glycosyltransferase family 39 protein [Spirochaetales bacterium]